MGNTVQLSQLVVAIARLPPSVVIWGTEIIAELPFSWPHVVVEHGDGFRRVMLISPINSYHNPLVNHPLIFQS
jgi:hypothetical protein